MLSKVAILRETIKKLVPMLASRGLRVTQVGAQAFVETDPKTLKPIRVNIPNLSDNADEALIIAIQGFIDHEVGHVLHTDWRAAVSARPNGESLAAERKMKRETAGQKMHDLANLVEDPFVEREMCKQFKGSSYNIDRLHDIFMEKISKPHIDKAKTPDEQLSCVIVPLVRFWAGQTKWGDFLKRYGYLDIPIVKSFVDAVPDDLKKRLGKGKNTWDNIEMARELFDILHPAPPPPPPAPPAPPTPSDDEDDDEQDQDENSDSEKSNDPDGSGSNTDKPEDEDDKGSAGEDSDEDQDDAGDEDSSDEGSDEEENDAGDTDEQEGDAEEDGDAEDEAAGDQNDESDDGSEGDSGEEDEEVGEGDGDEDEEDDGAEDASDGDGDQHDEDSDPSGDDESDDGDSDEDEGSESNDGGEDSSGDESEDSESDQEGAESKDEVEGESKSSSKSSDSSAGEKEQEGAGGEKFESEATEGDAQVDEAPEPSPFDGMDISLENRNLAEAIAFEVTNAATRETRDADYRVYTTEHDVIERFKINEEVDTAPYVIKMDDKTKHMVGPMQKDIERMMAARSQVVKVPGFRSGRLHGGSLHRLQNNDDRVFRRMQTNRSVETAVTLLIDNSGSMWGEKLHTAMAAGYALSQTLERVGIKHEVIGFTTATPNNRKVLREQEAEEKRIGKPFSRMGILYMPIYKEFSERITPDVKKRFAMAPTTVDAQSNIDGECVRIASNRLAMRTEPRKVLIVMSDGQPAGSSYFPHEIYADLHRAVAEAEAKKIETIGIGIMDASVKTFYPKHVVLNDLGDLPKTVMSELKRILAQ